MISNSTLSESYVRANSEALSSDTLIVGVDSQIGKRLSVVLGASGFSVSKTTRRLPLTGDRDYFLDLSAEQVPNSLPDAQTVVLCAGISTYASCSQDPASAARVNVVNTIKLASTYLRNRRHVVFISSAAALGEESMATEEAQCSPATVYGVLKRATELALEAEAKRYEAPLSIVRLTKVVSCDTQFIKNWVLEAGSNSPIKAFNNRWIAPISLGYACDALSDIIKKCSTGIFHFSGDHAYTYFEFARQMAFAGVFPESLIQQIESSSEDRQTGCRDTISLGMPRTAAMLSIQPQPLADVLKSLSAGLPEDSQR